MKRLSAYSASLLILLLCAGCATTHALHVIGIYRGQTPPGVDDRPWWAKCNDDKKTDGQGTTITLPTFECHRKYASEQIEKDVVAKVSDNSRPMVLALSAYEMTHWTLVLEKGVKILKIILAGYHSQRVTGQPPDTPIEVYTYDPSPCDRCWQGQQYFYSYKEPPKELKTITDLEVTSFQGQNVGAEFSIFRGMKKYE